MSLSSGVYAVTGILALGPVVMFILNRRRDAVRPGIRFVAAVWFGAVAALLLEVESAIAAVDSTIARFVPGVALMCLLIAVYLVYRGLRLR